MSSGNRRFACFAEPPASAVRLTRVREAHCRWPFGRVADGDFRFCGADKARGAYCAAHAALAYETYAERRARARCRDSA